MEAHGAPPGGNEMTFKPAHDTQLPAVPASAAHCFDKNTTPWCWMWLHPSVDPCVVWLSSYRWCPKHELTERVQRGGPLWRRPQYAHVNVVRCALHSDTAIRVLCPHSWRCGAVVRDGPITGGVPPPSLLGGCKASMGSDFRDDPRFSLASRSLRSVLDPATAP